MVTFCCSELNWSVTVYVYRDMLKSYELCNCMR